VRAILFTRMLVVATFAGSKRFVLVYIFHWRT